MIPANNTRMADMTDEEMSTVENEQLTMTESMTSEGMMTMQMNGMAEQLREITEMSELIVKETAD